MEPLSTDNLSTLVYQRLRASLMSGQFLPGQILKVRGLSAELGASATPVREALARLVSETALVQQDHRSVRVPSLEDYREVLQLRMLLEGTTAERAASLASEKDILVLERFHSKMMLAKQEKRFADNLIHNEHFHLTLYRLARMPNYQRVIENLWIKCGPLLNEGKKWWPIHHPDRHPRLTVLRGLKSGDGALARAGIEEDFRVHGNTVIAYLLDRRQVMSAAAPEIGISSLASVD
jgi:DNA-binding GntR family transcriptional regulator